MTPLSDDELLALSADPESDRAERKRAWTGDVFEKARQAVCAFANDLPNHGKPGVLLVGVNDDGSVADVPITDRLLQTLSDLKTDGKIVPPPTLSVERRLLKGAAIAVVTVWPADAPPVRYDGRIWIRIAGRRGLASAQDERILNERRRWRDRPYDAQAIAGCTLSDLNRVAFEHGYLPQAVAADVLAANDRSYEERLASTGMVATVDEPIPTVVGVLAVGRLPRTWVPCAYVQFLRIRGIEWGDPVADAQKIDGTLEVVLRRLDEKIKAHLAVAVDFASGTTTEVRSSAYALSALRQLTRNAVMHRSYEGTNAPVRVYWFDDRIEIGNPGGPYGTVTSENFGRPGITDYRNPGIAAVLKTLGFVQRFGFGIAEARRSLAANGNPDVEFRVEPTTLLAVLRRAP